MTRRLVRGSKLGKYRCEHRIATGATADVWRARDPIEGRRVALKVVHPAIVAEFGRDAIEHEARIAAHLEHPNIVAIRNADWIDGRFVIVTELATTSLDDYPRARRSARAALAIVRDVAAGLAHAHSRGVLHRDVKPENVVVMSDGTAKLTDFGTARLAPRSTRVLTEVGTFGYMAPEQAYGRPRFASDVFSWGLTAYQLFAGVLPGWPFVWPLEGHERFERRCPAPVQAVIRRALEPDPKRRWRDAGELHAALVAAIARHESRESAPAKGARRRKAPSHRAATNDPFALETRWFRRHFGKALRADFDCHKCGGPIAEAMRCCPWCGTDRNAFTYVTSYPLVCPDCERGVRPEWKACPWCATARLESNGRRPPLDRRATRTCRRKGCEGQLRPFMRYCPMCKTKVARPWKVESLPPCPSCRWPMAPRWRWCAWCGRRNAAALSIGRASGR
ncbi:MAG: serine/threonine-protein kinase [Myxococcota bacterium]